MIRLQEGLLAHPSSQFEALWEERLLLTDVVGVRLLKAEGHSCFMFACAGLITFCEERASEESFDRPLVQNYSCSVIPSFYLETFVYNWNTFYRLVLHLLWHWFMPDLRFRIWSRAIAAVNLVMEFSLSDPMCDLSFSKQTLYVESVKVQVCSTRSFSEAWTENMLGQTKLLANLWLHGLKINLFNVLKPFSHTA